MTIQLAQQTLRSQLEQFYDQREAANIADWVMEHITSRKRIDRLLDKQQLLSAGQISELDKISRELGRHRPVQYVLGEAWFAGMKLYVNESVLIPRPETEELVEWIVSDIGQLRSKELRIMDIGTGSGCIPLALQKKLPYASISAVEVSKEALMTAKQNAEIAGARIRFFHTDFLVERCWDLLPLVDIIVSNPPYIKQSESLNMSANVLDFEPRIALFVPDEDALVFYSKIAAFGKTHLLKGGRIFLEINEALGKEVVALYEQEGYVVELRKDLQKKDRMVKLCMK